jgi:hypothetical protein
VVFPAIGKHPCFTCIQKNWKNNGFKDFQLCAQADTTSETNIVNEGHFYKNNKSKKNPKNPPQAMTTASVLSRSILSLKSVCAKMAEKSNLGLEESAIDST